MRTQNALTKAEAKTASQRLGLGKKHEHEGHELWVKCMNGDKDAWKRMEVVQLWAEMNTNLIQKLAERDKLIDELRAAVLELKK